MIARTIFRVFGAMTTGSSWKYKSKPPQSAIAAAGLLIGLVLSGSAGSDAAGARVLRDKGKVLLQKNCGRCHAVERVGASPLKGAPAMRDIYVRFSPRELQAELAEGMVSRHREMPQIDFSDEDVDAILAYLYALAVKT